MKPLAFAELWQQRETEIRIFAVQLKLAQKEEAALSIVRFDVQFVSCRLAKDKIFTGRGY
jgi:hypothetical protein